MKNLALRGALAFGLPVLVVFALSVIYPQSYLFLAAGPLCGIAGGLAFGRRIGLALILAACFASIGFMFALQDVRSPWFSDVIWSGLVSGFLFWVAGGCAMLALPPARRFNGAAALVVPGALAGMAFQFLYGPAHFMFDLGAHAWWVNGPWIQLIMWAIAGAGGGYFFGRLWQREMTADESMKYGQVNRWATGSIAVAALGLGLGGFYLLRWKLPLGLINSLSPATAASDWLWGWGVLAASVASVAAFKPVRRLWATMGLALAIVLVLLSYRLEAKSWKSRFNSNYAQKLLSDSPASGDAIYTGNLILAQSALDNDDVAGAKQYLLSAASTTGARRIEQNGLDTSIARVLFDRGEKDAVLEYLQRGRTLWPQGAQTIGRWEAAIRAGRRPNFNPRGGGPGGGGQGGQGGGGGQGNTQN